MGRKIDDRAKTTRDRVRPLDRQFVKGETSAPVSEASQNPVVKGRGFVFRQ
jgi:hypothetical protein